MNSPLNGSAHEHELEKFPEFEEDPDVLLDAEPEKKIVTPAHDCSSHSNGKTNPIDAGNRGLDHYKRRLSPLRYRLRELILPLIRWETPYLAWMQDRMRTPLLDSYFAMTANLGTHTFFMISLPLLFWTGHTTLARAMVHMLAAGVFFTGFIKDLFSLPRPLSPPLQRITMSGSAALEYGFPSTHSANAVSVAAYALLTLSDPSNTLSAKTKVGLEILSYTYATSIVIGRLYCGMHGFLDVIVGSFIGFLIAYAEITYGGAFHELLHTSFYVPLALAVVLIILIRIHPEPADDCPCFDDSVAFLGVMIGTETGDWHYSTTSFSWSHPVPATVPFSLSHLGWVTATLRVVVGISLIIAWREVMKPTMLTSLPHVFRFFDKFGLILPRKFFKPASEYGKVPKGQKIDNVMPRASDLPKFWKAITSPGRGRAVSIGPQSAADAWETLAYRDKRRRESLESMSPNLTQRRNTIKFDDSAKSSGKTSALPLSLNTNSGSILNTYEAQMGAGHVILTPPTPTTTTHNPSNSISFPSTLDGMFNDEAEPDIMVGRRDELGEKEMFEKLEKPRVRYDVEVVTKLVVYAGIGWLAVEIVPVVFELGGLGMRHLSANGVDFFHEL